MHPLVISSSSVMQHTHSMNVFEFEQSKPPHHHCCSLSMNETRKTRLLWLYNEYAAQLLQNSSTHWRAEPCLPVVMPERLRCLTETIWLTLPAQRPKAPCVLQPFDLRWHGSEAAGSHCRSFKTLSGVEVWCTERLLRSRSHREASHQVPWKHICGRIKPVLTSCPCLPLSYCVS